MNANCAETRNLIAEPDANECIGLFRIQISNLFQKMKSEFLLNDTAFFGRPYEELLRCFGLTERELFGRRVLDCPAGPDSFVAEGLKRGIYATGVDPMYYRSPDALARLARADFSDMYKKIRESPERFSSRTYATVEESESARRDSLELFLDHYRKTYPNGCYVVAALPDLPFENDSFDISVCGHLFFIYAQLFDEAFHRKAVRELIRVTCNEIRIHPLVGMNGERHAFVDPVRNELALAGMETEIIDVDHEFFKGTNQTLVARSC